MITESSLTRHAKSEAGFTLVELLVVMSIVSILMGLGAFALVSYWRAQALTGATNTVLTDMRDVQVRAQAEVRTYRLVFFDDSDDRTYHVERFDGTDHTDPDHWTVLQIRVLDKDVFFDFTSTSFVSFSGCLSPNDPNEAIFCPRGVSSDGSVVIESLRLNQDREIRLRGLTSKAEVF